MFRKGSPKEDLEHIVGQIASTNTITLAEQELVPKGMGHVKCLHIAIECHGMILSRVLIDEGYVLPCHDFAENWSRRVNGLSKWDEGTCI